MLQTRVSTFMQPERRIEIAFLMMPLLGVPVWPSGKALGWQAKGLRFESASALLSLQKLWSVDTVF